MDTTGKDSETQNFVERIRTALAQVRAAQDERFDFPQAAAIQAHADFSPKDFKQTWAAKGQEMARNGAFKHRRATTNPLDGMVEDAETHMGAIAKSQSHWQQRVGDDIAELQQLAGQVAKDPGKSLLKEALVKNSDGQWLKSRQLGIANSATHLTVGPTILLLLISVAALAADVYFFELTLEAELKDLSETLLFPLAILITVLMGGAAYFAGSFFADARYARPDNGEKLNAGRKELDASLRQATRSSRKKAFALIFVVGPVLLVVGVLRIVEAVTLANDKREAYDAIVLANAASKVQQTLPAEPQVWGAVILQVLLVLVALLSLVVLFADGYLTQSARNRKTYAAELDALKHESADIQETMSADQVFEARADELKNELPLLPNHIADALRGVEASIEGAADAFHTAAIDELSKGGDSAAAAAAIATVESYDCPQLSLNDATVTHALELPTVLKAKAASASPGGASASPGGTP